MRRICLAIALFAVSIYVQGAPLSPYDDFVEAATAGDWDRVHSILVQNFAKDVSKNLSLGGVKELKPPKGGHVYGESEYTFHAASNLNGQTNEKSGGHKVINEDGRVKEFDFQPKIKPEDLFKKFGFKAIEKSTPLSPYDEFAEAATAGDWDKVYSIFAQNFAKDVSKNLSLGGVKELKPPRGGHVYGESEYTFHAASNVNGQTNEKSGGHKVINEDGRVKEFDFQPNIQPEDLFKKFGFKPIEQSK